MLEDDDDALTHMHMAHTHAHLTSANDAELISLSFVCGATLGSTSLPLTSSLTDLLLEHSSLTSYVTCMHFKHGSTAHSMCEV